MGHHHVQVNRQTSDIKLKTLVSGIFSAMIITKTENRSDVLYYKNLGFIVLYCNEAISCDHLMLSSSLVFKCVHRDQ